MIVRFNAIPDGDIETSQPLDKAKEEVFSLLLCGPNGPLYENADILHPEYRLMMVLAGVTRAASGGNHRN